MKPGADAAFVVVELERWIESAEMCDQNCGCKTGGNNANCNPTPPVNLYCGR